MYGKFILVSMSHLLSTIGAKYREPRHKALSISMRNAAALGKWLKKCLALEGRRKFCFNKDRKIL